MNWPNGTGGPSVGQRAKVRGQRQVKGTRAKAKGKSRTASLPDASGGNRHLLLTLGLTIEPLTAFAEVIERCGDRIVFGCRPVRPVCLQPVVLSINGAIATQ